uniref:Reverse transcriptase domain-containing protein n=1 Tax=Tanacetum cinerariifolium TaxID=118510 RepID=A0A699H896_TANCI|nr:hypothetical protein CTI12_AA182560 [Tanacetum cinerariifolium]
MTFDETSPPSKTSPLVDDDLDEEEEIKVTEKKNLENDIEDETLEIDEIVNIKESRNHPLENVIGNLNQRTLRSQAQNQSKMTLEEELRYTKSYILTISDENYLPNNLKPFIQDLECRTIHEVTPLDHILDTPSPPLPQPPPQPPLIGMR